MPSFAFLRSPRGSRTEPAAEVNVLNGGGRAEKVQRQQSKREYFRSLLKRSSISSQSKADRRKSRQLGKARTLSSPSPAEQPTSPMNKPLPPPPAPGTEDAPAKKPALQLQRIISPITLPELHKLFSGAPQFFCRSEGHHTGAPHPSVAFPWDLEVRLRDLCDHVRIQDEAWSCVTAWPHVTVQVAKNPEATKEHHKKQRAHFLPRCRERPNMLSMQGLERGTMGYQAALESGVADALEMRDEVSSETVSEKRIEFLTRKVGLRPITDSMLVDHLVEVGELYQEDPLKHKKSTIELYTKLFTQLLFPPSKVIDSDDPYSLEVQIDSLVQVLAAPTVWVDFGLVEWRIKLGHILWGASNSPENDDEFSNHSETMQEPGTQRYWLLLQVLLACELVIRLDTIAINIERGVDVPKPAEIRRFEKDATQSVKWSILLARAWLENIKVQKPTAEELSEKKPAGWLSTLTMGAVGVETRTNDLLESLQFHGRYQAQQLSGLVHFARKIQWPHIKELEVKAAANGIKISDIVGDSAAGTPLSMATNRSSSYFSNRKPNLRRGLSHMHIPAIIHPGGWLSNSYLSGLVLPGESLSHLLMSTLLENDTDALPRLGEQANLYGGFIYFNRSFWSTACIVGRVLAAKAKATECIGWVSSDVVPKGASEGWVDIDVESFPSANDKKTKARVYQKTAIETEGNVIGGADSSSVLPGDFILPSDDFQHPPLDVAFESLDLFTAVDSVHSSPTTETPVASPMSIETEAPNIRTYSAMMRFSVQTEGEEKKELNLSLSHDVQFVTAHPCVFSETEVLKGPGSEDIGVATGHPLHKAFTYTLLPLSTLLLTPPSTRLSALLTATISPNPSSPSPSPIPTAHSTIPKVLVIDCTTEEMVGKTKVAGVKRSAFGSDREMVIRAICAERGWNALVSRRGRGCLSCAIREFGALGWGGSGIVVRVA